MRKISLLFIILSFSSMASDLYKCSFYRENENGVDKEEIKTGWLKADKNGNTLNLQGLDGLYPVAVKTNFGIKVAICDKDVCDSSDPVAVGEYAGLASVTKINGYRHSIECSVE